MTKPALYLETSVVGYATSRPSRDLVVAGHQQVTREWFALRAEGYELFVSQLVASEASRGRRGGGAGEGGLLAGNPSARHHGRRERTRGQARRERSSAPEGRGKRPSHHGRRSPWSRLPPDCRHIANAAMRQAIEGVCSEAGYEPPVICTPEELMNDKQR